MPLGRGLAQGGCQFGFGTLAQNGRCHAQRAGNIGQQLTPDSAPVVFDQVQVGCRDPGTARQLGLLHPEDRAALADPVPGVEEADELVIESKADAVNEQAMNSYIRSRALLPEGQTLDNLLSGADYARVQELARLLQLDEYAVSRMQPWFLRIVLANEIFEQSGMQRTLGVDTLFEQTAIGNDMKISSLETPQEAMMTLAEYPLEVQLQQLSEALNDPPDDNRQDNLGGLLVSWATGDIERNARLIANSMSPLTYRNVVVKRNEKWLPRVERYFNKPQQTMVVVGNAHLVGKGNMIDMLKRRGYRVSRVQ